MNFRMREYTATAPALGRPTETDTRPVTVSRLMLRPSKSPGSVSSRTSKRTGSDVVFGQLATSSPSRGGAAAIILPAASRTAKSEARGAERQLILCIWFGWNLEARQPVPPARYISREVVRSKQELLVAEGTGGVICAGHEDDDHHHRRSDVERCYAQREAHL